MWVKICGIRDVASARAVAVLGPDAIGLNFYARSPRVVDVETAAEIVRALPDGVEPIGLFVNHSTDEIASAVERTGINTVQLHGDESPRDLAALQKRLPTLRILRAHRLGPKGTAELSEYLTECRKLGVNLFGCLVDALSDGVYGGSGKTVAWEAVSPAHRDAQWPRLVLAGGLKPDNVAEAVTAVQPWGVDVASGVEASPGVKDLAAVKAFIASARGSKH